MLIGQIAERTSLTVDAIRFYERRKLLPKADRSAGRFRLYTEDAVERLRFIVIQRSQRYPIVQKPGTARGSIGAQTMRQ